MIVPISRMMPSTTLRRPSADAGRTSGSKWFGAVIRPASIALSESVSSLACTPKYVLAAASIP